jgi:hypothetical protein
VISDDHAGLRQAMYVTRLRKKIETDAENPKLIKAVRGIEYSSFPVRNSRQNSLRQKPTLRSSRAAQDARGQHYKRPHQFQYAAHRHAHDPERQQQQPDQRIQEQRH